MYYHMRMRYVLYYLHLDIIRYLVGSFQGYFLILENHMEFYEIVLARPSGLKEMIAFELFDTIYCVFYEIHKFLFDSLVHKHIVSFFHYLEASPHDIERYEYGNERIKKRKIKYLYEDERKYYSGIRIKITPIMQAIGLQYEASCLFVRPA